MYYKGGKKLRVFAFGVALGIVFGLKMLLMAWAGWLWHLTNPFLPMMSTFYVGYAATFLGGVYGFLWGFVDGFVFGIVLAALYNFFACCCCKKYSGECDRCVVEEKREPKM